MSASFRRSFSFTFHRSSCYLFFLQLPHSFPLLPFPFSLLPSMSRRYSLGMLRWIHVWNYKA
jgi:hypothetical protein